MFRIEMLPAAHGDSLLITYGEPGALHHVLIDGGPLFAYRNRKFVERPTLSRRIRQLIDEGGSLELMVITHVDADHIESPVKLLGNKPPDLKIADVWFNGWRHLKPHQEDKLGPLQGEMLSALIQQKELPWNSAYGGGAVAIKPGQALPFITLPGGLQLTLLSPTVSNLVDLSREWAKVLNEEGLDPDSPDAALERLKKSRLKPDDLLGDHELNVEALAARPFTGDDGLPNGSSIAFLAQYEGKRCLFGGDAHAPVLQNAVEQLLQEQETGRLQLDAFKIPHHGSKNNISADLLNLLKCKRYLVSTNGAIFHHPDQEAMARIIAHGGEPVLCFNYRSEENAIWDDAKLRREHGYETVYGDEAVGGLVLEL
jgi:beta-lactamase superfamily II metal-dependent hydrolase